MTFDPRFLGFSEIFEIHANELRAAGGLAGIRDEKLLESAVAASQATFNGEFLMNIFEMAATCLNSIVLNHPFLDGNKRTALASALTFFLLMAMKLRKIMMRNWPI